MVASYAIIRLTGAGPTQTSVSNVRLRTDDANTADLTNPAKIKGVKTRTFWASLALQPNGTFTQVQNIRIYCDGAIGWTMGTTGKLKIGNRDSGDIGVPTGSYVQATGTVNSSGDDFETAHSYFSSQVLKSKNIESYTSSAPGLVDSTAITVAGTLSKHAVLQGEIDTDAVQGVQATETISMLADEI